MKSLPCICGSGADERVAEQERENEGLAAHQCKYPAGDEFGNAYCTEIERVKGDNKRLGTRIKELEHILRRVREWGADARSADSYEIFRDVRAALREPETVTVVDCTCIVCVCEGDRCLGCGARMCLGHEELLKSSLRPSREARYRVGRV